MSATSNHIEKIDAVGQGIQTSGAQTIRVSLSVVSLVNGIKHDRGQVESNKDISVRLGTLWKNLDADSKETYYSAARKADEEHKQKYPGYYYSPKEARMRKGLKQRRNIVGAPPAMDALRFVKVFMTAADKSSLVNEESTSLLRKLQPKPEVGQNVDSSLTQSPSVSANGDVQNQEDIAVVE